MLASWVEAVGGHLVAASAHTNPGWEPARTISLFLFLGFGQEGRPRWLPRRFLQPQYLQDGDLARLEHFGASLADRPQAKGPGAKPIPAAAAATVPMVLEDAVPVSPRLPSVPDELPHGSQNNMPLPKAVTGPASSVSKPAPASKPARALDTVSPPRASAALEPEPVVERGPEPVVEPGPEPVVEPGPEPVVEPAVEPGPESAHPSTRSPDDAQTRSEVHA